MDNFMNGNRFSLIEDDLLAIWFHYSGPKHEMTMVIVPPEIKTEPVHYNQIAHDHD